MMFVLSLKRGMYLYQFGQYAWTHMILMIIFVPSSFFVSNIFEGLIWFLLPSALIITNDIMAYLAGVRTGFMCMGRARAAGGGAGSAQALQQGAPVYAAIIWLIRLVLVCVGPASIQTGARCVLSVRE
jgi:hypothetical protein